MAIRSMKSRMFVGCAPDQPQSPKEQTRKHGMAWDRCRGGLFPRGQADAVRPDSEFAHPPKPERPSRYQSATRQRLSSPSYIHFSSTVISIMSPDILVDLL